MIHPPFILADLRNMALIVRHYWRALNTCPKAVGARGTQKQQFARFSLGREEEKTRAALAGDEWAVTLVFVPPGEKRPRQDGQSMAADPPLTRHSPGR